MGEIIVCKDENHYKELKAKAGVYDAEVERKNPPSRSGWRSYDPKTIESPPVTNEERSAIEAWEFAHGRAENYTAYVSRTGDVVTTWTGQVLGRITRRGREWKDSFGGTRVPLEVAGINGLMYHGTYFKSSGDYCHLKVKRARGAVVTCK